MTDLKHRLETADTNDANLRELSDEVLLAMGALMSINETNIGPDPVCYINGKKYIGNIPNPAASVDDALALVPRDKELQIKSWERGRKWKAEISPYIGPIPKAYPTPALAMCAALVEMVEETEKKPRRK